MNDANESAEPLIAVARAVKTRGLNGEIVADLLTDFPERFEEIAGLIVVAPDGKRTPVKLENHWFHQNRVVLKLAGFDSIEDASGFVGSEFAVPERDRVQLPEGHFYDWELEGFVVETVSGVFIGRIREVMRVSDGVEMLVVQNDEQKDHLIPMVESIVVEIDATRRLIRVDPPDGLLEL